MKVVVAVIKKERALLGTFSVIVKCSFPALLYMGLIMAAGRSADFWCSQFKESGVYEI